MGKGQKLYSKAKQIVAGGNMLLSKRPEMFLPEHWPSYFSKSKGCEVWDLDGNKYIDTLMTPGTNSLGYSHPEVDEAVKEIVGNGNMSSLNAPEEVELTERLVELHPWADMARFARSGGEANSVAIRLARAASGRDNVAFCGYHGWHDWYLASNLSDSKGLDGHLLPGLDPYGVPQNLKGSVYPFEYNNFDKLDNLVKTKNIGVIKMEVFRNKEPENDYDSISSNKDLERTLREIVRGAQTYYINEGELPADCWETLMDYGYVQWRPEFDSSSFECFWDFDDVERSVVGFVYVYSGDDVCVYDIASEDLFCK